MTSKKSSYTGCTSEQIVIFQEWTALGKYNVIKASLGEELGNALLIDPMKPSGCFWARG